MRSKLDTVKRQRGSLRIFVLRDEGGYASIEDRAWTVAQGLEDARRLGRGEFLSVHTGGADTVVFRPNPSQEEVRVLSVTRRDARAYGIRSGRRVTPDLLAAYWSALLNDYWAIAFEQTPPSRTVSIHEGEALTKLYQAVVRSSENGAQNLGSVAQQLPRDARRHLDRLAAVVPVDFSEERGHEAEER